MLARRLTPILNGASIQLLTWPPTDMPWNVREMHVRHPDGHMFRVNRGLEEEE